MVVSASYELKTFGASVLMALAFGLLYDLVRAFSRVTEKKVMWDLFGWSASCVLCGTGWFYFLGGELRWYMVVAALFSGILYFLTLEKYVFLAFSFLSTLIYRFFNIILKIVLTPLKILCKILGVYIKKAKTKFFRKVEDKNYEKKACIKD